MSEVSGPEYRLFIQNKTYFVLFVQSFLLILSNNKTVIVTLIL